MATIDTGLFPSATFKIDTGETMPVTSRLNALRESQMKDISFRQAQQQEADNMLIQQAYNAPDPVNFLAQQGRGDLAIGLQDAQAKHQAAQLEQQSGQLAHQSKVRDFINQGLLAITNDPSDEHIMQWGNQAVSGGYLPADAVQNSVQGLLSVPVDQRANYIRSLGMTAQQQYEANKPEKVVESDLARYLREQKNYKPNSPEWKSYQTKINELSGGMSEYQRQELALRRQQEERLAKAAEAEAKAKAESGATVSTTSPTIAKAFLSNIGYDVDKDTDNISGLILGSTSGGLEEAGAGMYEWLTGESTKGMTKISQLQQASARATLDLMPGGKLSAGISNEDRKMIQQLNGDIGNPKLSDTRRLAAWRQLVDIMKANAGYTSAPTPGGAGMGAGAQTSSMSSNPAVEALVKQYATPTNTGKK